MFIMPVGSAYLSESLSSNVSTPMDTLRLRCCPQPGFMASKSTSRQSLNTLKMAKERGISKPAYFYFLSTLRYAKLQLTKSKPKILSSTCLKNQNLVTQTSNAKKVDRSIGKGKCKCKNK